MRTFRTAHSGLSSVLLIALPALAPAQEQESVRGQDPAARQDDAVDPDTLDRRRILHLDDGTVLRLRARFQDGAWQQRQNGQWVDVEGVVDQRLEKEALAEARGLEGEIKRSETTPRVALAEWMVGQGLFPEAISQLDRVLRAEPEHGAALNFIERTAIPVELANDPKDGLSGLLLAIIKKGAIGSPATREVCIRHLADLDGHVNVRSVVENEMKTMQFKRREFAAHAARRLFEGDLLGPLAERALYDTSSMVREAASLSLRDAESVDVLGTMIAALGSKHANVRSNAAEAMGNMGYRASVQPMINHLANLQAGGGATGSRANFYLGKQIALVTDFDVEIAQGSSIADPIVTVQDSGAILDVRTTVQMTKVIEMRTIMGSLAKITGAKAGMSPKKWSKWWEENQDDWQAVDHARAMVRPETGPETPK